MNAAKTHCKEGHPFEGHNLVMRSRRGGERRCRICHYKSKRASAKKMRQLRKLVAA
jgi:hypothetical protein